MSPFSSPDLMQKPTRLTGSLASVNARSRLLAETMPIGIDNALPGKYYLYKSASGDKKLVTALGGGSIADLTGAIMPLQGNDQLFELATYSKSALGTPAGYQTVPMRGGRRASSRRARHTRRRGTRKHRR
jgi:hypothetical protein